MMPAAIAGDAIFQHEDAVGFFHAAGEGIVIFQRSDDDYETFVQAVEKHAAGYRWYDPETGEFWKARPAAAAVARSRAQTPEPIKRKAPSVQGPRGREDISGNETPAIGRDRTSLVVRMSLPVRSELLRLAEQSDEDGDETGGFLFGRPSYGARGRVIEITSAVRAAKDRERTSFSYDYPVLRSHLNGDSSGRLRIIGDFHTHPETSSANRASHDDRVVWLQHLDLFRANEDPRLTEWLSLVLAYDPRSTALLRTRCMYAWVTRRDRGEGPLTEKVGFRW